MNPMSVPCERRWWMVCGGRKIAVCGVFGSVLPAVGLTGGAGPEVEVNKGGACSALSYVYQRTAAGVPAGTEVREQPVSIHTLL